MKNKIFLLLFLWNLFIAGPVLAGGDVLKNIPLSGCKISFGLDNRLRYEAMDDYDFKSNDSYAKIYNRLTLNSKLEYKDSLILFVEGLDGREGVFHTKRSNQSDGLDLHQAYLQLNNLLDSNVSLKLGRQKLKYGKKRLIADPSWGNKVRSFDAAVVNLKFADLSTDLFAANVVNYDDNNFNDCQGHEILTGIYNVYKFSGRFLADIYFMSQIDNDTMVRGEDRRFGHIERHTTGTRFDFNPADSVTFDFEAAYQFGKNGTSPIDAYAYAFYMEKDFDYRFNPKIKLEFNLASGDSDLSDNEYNTFVPVYQTTHGPYGIIDFFRWQNLREAAFFGSLDLTEKISVNPEFHSYWLDRDSDKWYMANGTTLFSNTTGNTSSHAGLESSVVIKYDWEKYVKLELGYSHFFPGRVAREAAEADGVDFAYFQTKVSF